MMTPETTIKYASILYLLIIGLASIYVAFLYIINGKNLPDYITMIIGSGITYCLTTLSINHGSQIALKGVATNATNSTSISQ